MTVTTIPPADAQETEALRARVATLEASIAGLRRELLIEKRRQRPDAPNGSAARLAAIEASRGYRVCTAYYALYGNAVIGAPLRLARNGMGWALRAIHGWR